MQRRLRLLAFCAVTLTCVLLLAASPLPRALLAQLASHWLRPEVHIGALHWQLFPRPAINLLELTLRPPEGGEAFAHLERLALSLRNLTPELDLRGLTLALTPERLQADYWLHPQPDTDEALKLPNITLENARIDYRSKDDAAPWQLTVPLFILAAQLPDATPSLTVSGQLQPPEALEDNPLHLTFNTNLLLDDEMRAITRGVFTFAGELGSWHIAPTAQLLLHGLPLAANAWPEKVELSAHALREEEDQRDTLELAVHGSPESLDFAFQMQQADGDTLAAAHARLALDELTLEEDALRLPLRALRLTVPNVCAHTPHQLEFADTDLRYTPETGALRLNLAGSLDEQALRLKLAHEPQNTPRWRAEGTLAALDLGDCPGSAAQTPADGEDNPLAFVALAEYLPDLFLQLSVGDFHLREIRAHNLRLHLSP